MNSPSNRHFGLAPSPWVVRFAPLVAPGKRVLDLAAGRGRHALFFAARGVQVLAVDRDAAALATFAGSPGIETRVADLEQRDWPFSTERFDAIVVTNYLHRPLLATLVASLEPGGLLVYETFARGNERFGKPSNPDFLLQESELLELARKTLTIVAFEQGCVDGAPPAVLQRLAAVGRGRAWPPLLPQVTLE